MFGKKAREILKLQCEAHVLREENYRLRVRMQTWELAFRTIADMETPSANATVKRMAKVAREAL